MRMIATHDSRRGWINVLAVDPVYHRGRRALQPVRLCEDRFRSFGQRGLRGADRGMKCSFTGSSEQGQRSPALRHQVRQSAHQVQHSTSHCAAARFCRHRVMTHQAAKHHLQRAVSTFGVRDTRNVTILFNLSLHECVVMQTNH